MIEKPDTSASPSTSASCERKKPAGRNPDAARSGWSTGAVLAVANALALTSSLRGDVDSDGGNDASDAPVKMPNFVVEDDKLKTASSPKFTQPLVDTPQTIVVIPHEVYTQQAAVSLSDILRNTPGITFAAGEGGSAASTAGDSFYMRGYDTTNNIFVDGVRDVGAYTRDVYNIQQVEIAKGPEGSDIGRGGTSGYVNLVSKTPTLANSYAGTVSYGFDGATSGDRRRATADVNQALPSSPVPGTAVRLNLMEQDSAVAGRDYANNRSWGVASSLALGLGTPTRFDLSFQHETQNNPPDYGLPVPAFPGYVSTPPSPSIDWRKFYGFLSDFDHIEHDAFTAKIEHDLGADVRLSNQTRYSSVQREAIVTGPGSNTASYVPATGLLSRSRQANKRDTDILSNQTNLTAKVTTAGIEQDLSAGLEFSHEKAYSPAFVSVTLAPIPVDSPDPTGTPSGTPVRSGAWTNAHVKTTGLYAFDTVKLSEHWQLDGGMRLDQYRMDYLSIAVGGVATTVKTDGDLLSWKGGLVFKPVPAASIYAAAGVSFIPPGTDFTLSSAVGNQNNPDTDPQKTTSIEVGTKWEFFRDRLTASAAVFKTENNKTVYTDPILGAIPAGKQTVQGLELNLSGKVSDAWLLFGGFAYLDSEINQGLTTGNNPAGAELPLIPRVSGNLWTTYRLPWGLLVGGGTQYVGETNRRDATTVVPRTMPAYWLWSAVVSYDLNKHASLRLNVTNVFDQRYVASFNNNGARFNPGLPRAYTISADFKF